MVRLVPLLFELRIYLDRYVRGTSFGNPPLGIFYFRDIMENGKIISLLLVFTFLISLNLGYNFFPSPKHITFFAPAISDDGKGSLFEFEMFYQPGEGRTLVNVQNAKFQADVENALRKAKFNAYKYLGIPGNKYDLIFQAKDGSDVSGESAGAMFAIAIIALHTGKKIRSDVTISATISEDGTLSDVGGIEEKIIAAKDGKRKAFLVSATQKIKGQSELEKGIAIIRVGKLEDAVSRLLE
jgi:predicted S18 family serine protease